MKYPAAFKKREKARKTTENKRRGSSRKTRGLLEQNRHIMVTLGTLWDRKWDLLCRVGFTKGTCFLGRREDELSEKKKKEYSHSREGKAVMSHTRVRFKESPGRGMSADTRERFMGEALDWHRPKKMLTERL